MTLQKKWIFAPPVDSEKVNLIKNAFGLSSIIASILIRRGYSTVEDVQSFFHPDLRELRNPYQLRHMKEAITILSNAVIANKKIAVLGDYDVDGITATAMMIDFLRSCGCRNLQYFIPNRLKHGYGLTTGSTNKLLEMKPDLVVTVDNGITAKIEVNRLKHHGIQTIITDHHLADPEKLPDCVTVNPNHPQCAYPFKKISGCGVALKVVMALRKELRENGWWTMDRPEPNLKVSLDLAAMGTVADVVPLVDENRIIVYHGLQIMNIAPRPAVKAMVEFKNVSRITSRTLAFQFGPLLNAAGRLQDASIAVQLLLSSNMRESRKIVQQLTGVNTERQQIEADMVETAVREARKVEDCFSLAIASADFHEGINGIVASRMVDIFYKPTIIFSEKGELYKGSARSIPELHITNALSQCSELLERYGGHAGAAGCTVHRTNFKKFINDFEQVCRDLLGHFPVPQLFLEEEIQEDQLTDSFVEQMNMMQPFGEANKEPLFAFGVPQFPFQSLKGKHVKWRLNGSVDIIGWNMADTFNRQFPKKLAVVPEFNEFRGKRKIQLIIDEFY